VIKLGRPTRLYRHFDKDDNLHQTRRGAINSVVTGIVPKVAVKITRESTSRS
jgi:hypothetical protein